MKLKFTLLALMVCLLNASFAQMMYKNGSLSTGNRAKDSLRAPGVYKWSELQDSANAVANTIAGFQGYYTDSAEQFTLADNFTVPAGEQWHVTGVGVYAYVVGDTSSASPFDGLRFRILNAPPDSAGAVVVFGNLTDNRFSSSIDSLLYRIFNTVIPIPIAPTTDRKIWKINGSANAQLMPGNYWIEWQTHAKGDAANFAPAATVIGHRSLPGWNAKQGRDSGSAWIYSDVTDFGNPLSTPVPQDFPFEIIYTKTLPVTFLNFDGILRNGQAVLNWSTSNEINNKGFEVQKSADAQNFSDIGFVQGAGSSSTVNNYNFTDAKLLSGSNYYRLKQIDLDGRFNYSSTIKLDFSKFDWAILGNPATNSSWIQLQLDKTANVSVQIISLNGKIIQSINKGNISTGTYTMPLTLSNQASGVYIIKLIVDNQTFSKKIIR
ncbi:MAG: T9SS type A sorting domain-containing protein [Chitinophagaceae bacterium]